jgi:hypothetical protein
MQRGISQAGVAFLQRILLSRTGYAEIAKKGGRVIGFYQRKPEY